MPTFKNISTSESATVENIYGKTVVVFPGATVETYKLSLPSFLEKISDTPYLPLVKINQTVTVPGNITNLLTSKIIRLISSSSGTTVGANSSSNTNVMTLPVNTPLDIENNGEIESLHFTGTGTVVVTGM